MKQVTTATPELPEIPVTVNKELDKLRTDGLFAAKVARANEMLRKDKETKAKKNGQA